MPKELVWFERLQYAHLALYLLGQLKQHFPRIHTSLSMEVGKARAMAAWEFGMVAIMLSAITHLFVVLIYQTERRQNKTCRTVLLILFVISGVSLFFGVLSDTPINALQVGSLIVSAVSYVFVFTGAGAEYFK